MIKCKNCDNRYDYTARPCAICGAEVPIDKEDVDFTRRELERAISQRASMKIFSCRHLLADAGITEQQREFAKLLELGEHRLTDPDAAAKYYYKAARKNDPYSAYRYSRLILETNKDHASFWLKYAAVIGSPDAYPRVAELFSLEGKEALATYYYSLAASCDDPSSVVIMAKRYYEGLGVTPDERCAKWYLDKLRIPPVNAIKLAYKLRSVRSIEPEKLLFPDLLSYIRGLAEEGKRLGFFTAYFYLVSKLADKGDANAEAAAGILLAEGKGTKRDLVRAKQYLTRSIEHKNPAAAIYLGEEYLKGTLFEQNTAVAIKYFERAAELGYPGAYEKIGDVYREGRLVEKNMAKAIELYERAAAGGSASARKKAEDFKAKREECYMSAYRIIELRTSVTEEEAKDAFRSAAIATALGEIRAAKLLARCYAQGIGTKIDRKTAFFWYKHAAEGGDREAYLPLALCYSRGFGTKFSYRMATKYLASATYLGFNGAHGELERLNVCRMKHMVNALYSDAMRLIYQKNYTRAFEVLTALDRFSHPKALYTLGCLYEFGIGTPRSDRSTAAKYYAAARAGSTMFRGFTDADSKYKRTVLRMLSK